jgi:predicted DNA-binding transcriptional regulator AlpA
MNTEILKSINDRLARLEGLLLGTKATEYLDSAQVMQLLKIGRTRLHELINQGKLVPKKVGGRLFFHRSEIDKQFED